MKVFDKQCQNCLMSPDSIVSPTARKRIIQKTVQEQSFFICHKSSMKGGDVCCRKFYDELGHNSQLVRIAERLGCVQVIEQKDNEKLPTYKEMNNDQRATENTGN